MRLFASHVRPDIAPTVARDAMHARPAIDLRVPEHLETATFGAG